MMHKGFNAVLYIIRTVIWWQTLIHTKRFYDLSFDLRPNLKYYNPKISFWISKMYFIVDDNRYLSLSALSICPQILKKCFGFIYIKKKKKIKYRQKCIKLDDASNIEIYDVLTY